MGSVVPHDDDENTKKCGAQHRSAGPRTTPEGESGTAGYVVGWSPLAAQFYHTSVCVYFTINTRPCDTGGIGLYEYRSVLSASL